MSANSAATDQQKPEAKSAAKPKDMLVLDTTAQPDTTDATGRVISGARMHEQIIEGTVRSFKFEHGKATRLPAAIALKFLRHDAFKLVDENGNPIEYKRPPKQPEELGAGEALKLADNETVARYDELSTRALLQRAIPMPGGEQFAARGTPDREGMIAFILKAKNEAKKLNTSKQPDVGADAFVPDAELEDEAA